MMQDATLKEWGRQCAHYTKQRQMLKENNYAEHTRLAKKWHKQTGNKISCLMSNGRHVWKILRKMEGILA